MAKTATIGGQKRRIVNGTVDWTGFKRKKLTMDEKVTKKVVNQVAKETLAKIKSSVVKKSGALKYSLAKKAIGKGGRAKSIIGVKARYSKKVRGVLKIPNLYALKAEKIHHFLRDNINSALVAELRKRIKVEVQRMVNG